MTRWKTQAQRDHVRAYRSRWLRQARDKATKQGMCRSCRTRAVKPECRYCVECLSAASVRKDRREGRAS